MYGYTRDEGAKHPLFIFNTAHADIYKVEFFHYDSALTEKFFALTFFPVSKSFYGYDPEVSSTVVQIIVNFLKNDSEIVLWYMCSPEDYNPRTRHILFNKWFVEFSKNTQDYSRFDQIFSGYEAEAEKYYISIIYNHTVFMEESIENDLKLTISSIENSKD